MSILSSFLKKPFQAIENKITNARLDIQAEISVILAKVIVMLALAFFLLLAATLGSVGLALFINFKANHAYLGYLIVGGGYILLVLIMYLLYNKGLLQEVAKKIAESIIFDQDEES